MPQKSVSPLCGRLSLWIETDKKLDAVLDKIEELSPAVSTEELFGTGCVWDAYTFISGLHRFIAVFPVAPNVNLGLRA